ncbi:GTPase HflX [Halothermothrix orenii]|uniref:GTPase HflX n=1 Tax=Halothermothrix orenii (strain H 168 / OCM 544 / DSM 9562) TaxID=373903 RepID=B8CX48_HALOH|nr:GTPase HflX [Halothermothrix orenii]ACL69867.1 small GTP-binding protein [Halothermothrix orenii H 168]
MVGQDEISLEELKRLADTAGVKVLKKLMQRRFVINPAFYIGKGKLKELKHLVFENGANLVIFDNELTPAQFRNLENFLETRVVDRTQLILDIFAQHAHTRESKLQVELAQLQYLLPRLTGKGEELSRLGGGIGTRGPGETKLEIDRRRIEKRIYKLKQELKNVKKNRQIQRKSRKDPVVALVGYTNAGKSTLLNTLTNANTEVADKLFATLDSTLRRLTLPFGKQIIISDTVGFIKKLPHQLVASFQATLEEIKEADILLHVVDSSEPELENHIKVVNAVLKELGVFHKEKIMVLNKIDRLEKGQLLDLGIKYPRAVPVSALSGKCIDNLMGKICEIMLNEMTTVHLKIPYHEAGWINTIHHQGLVLKEKYVNDSIIIKATIPTELANRLKKYTY